MKFCVNGSVLRSTKLTNSAETASSKRGKQHMAELTGSEILAKSLKNEGTDILFFLMGGPMLLAESSCIKEGIRPLDVRHEQSAAFMGQAYSRLLQKPSVCMAASGPGVINLTTGIANALIDCCPVVAVGGSSPIGQNGRLDQRGVGAPARNVQPGAAEYLEVSLRMMRCTSLLVRSPNWSLKEAKMVFRFGSCPATHVTKSVAAVDLPCCGGAMIAIFGRLPSFRST